MRNSFRRPARGLPLADSKRLSIVAGTQRRHEQCYLEALRRIQAGDIGRIVAARCSWNQGGLWVKPRQPEWSEMEWQLRNWLYFTWTSGDHIVEQHLHNLDVVRWALGVQSTADSIIVFIEHYTMRCLPASLID